MVRGQREKMMVGPTGDKRFEEEGGSEVLADEGLDCTVEVYMSEESRRKSQCSKG